MVHYFVVRYENGEYYNVGIDGCSRQQAEEYFHSISSNVRHLKTVKERKYKNFKDVGIGKIIYCKYLHTIPKGLSPDSRETII